MRLPKIACDLNLVPQTLEIEESRDTCWLLSNQWMTGKCLQLLGKEPSEVKRCAIR
jgi:hypothetical protein